MCATHTAVPTPLDTELPTPIPGDEHAHCPVTEVLRRVGDKWSVLVIVLLGQRPYRWGELNRRIEDISHRMLTRTLRGLEEDGLVERRVFPTVPPSVEYDLSPLGRSLLGPLSTLANWAVEHQPDIAAARLRHAEEKPEITVR